VINILFCSLDAKNPNNAPADEPISAPFPVEPLRLLFCNILLATPYIAPIPAPGTAPKPTPTRSLVKLGSL
jgi:hypothetical protein